MVPTAHFWHLLLRMGKITVLENSQKIWELSRTWFCYINLVDCSALFRSSVSRHIFIILYVEHEKDERDVDFSLSFCSYLNTDFILLDYVKQ